MISHLATFGPPDREPDHISAFFRPLSGLIPYAFPPGGGDSLKPYVC
jgi:hypothetical protein